MIRVVLLAILFVLIARVFWRVFDGVIAGASGASSGRKAGRQPPAAAVKLVRDPVCGTFVAPASALSLTSGGSTHYFCSAGCRDSFQKGAA